jgi:hypothetical protein
MWNPSLKQEQWKIHNVVIKVECGSCSTTPKYISSSFHSPTMKPHETLDLEEQLSFVG